MSVTGDSAISDTAAHVRLDMSEGATLETYVDLDAPLPLAERRAKIAAKVRALLPEAAANAVIALDERVAAQSAREIAEGLAALATTPTT